MQEGSYLIVNGLSAGGVPNMRYDSIGHFVFDGHLIRLNANMHER